MHAQSCPTLCNPVDCSPPGSSVSGILQARILEWVAIPFSRGSSRTRNQTRVSHIGRRIFYHWNTSEFSLVSCHQSIPGRLTPRLWKPPCLKERKVTEEPQAAVCATCTRLQPLVSTSAFRAWGSVLMGTGGLGRHGAPAPSPSPSLTHSDELESALRFWS